MLVPPTPVPTPKATKPSANAIARRRKTHFALRRSLGKNIRSSALDALRRARERDVLRRCAWARAMSGGFSLKASGAGDSVRSATVADTEKTALPPYSKIELHVHLEATVRPETLLEIARRNDFVLPADTVEGIRDLYRYRDFDHFIEVWILTTNALQTADDFRQVVVDYAA